MRSKIQPFKIAWAKALYATITRSPQPYNSFAITASSPVITISIFRISSTDKTTGSASHRCDSPQRCSGR